MFRDSDMSSDTFHASSSPKPVADDDQPDPVCCDVSVQPSAVNQDSPSSPKSPGAPTTGDEAPRAAAPPSVSGNPQTSSRTKISFSISNILSGSRRSGVTNSDDVTTPIEESAEKNESRADDVSRHAEDSPSPTSNRVHNGSSAEKMTVTYSPWTHPYYYRKYMATHPVVVVVTGLY